MKHWFVTLDIVTNTVSIIYYVDVPALNGNLSVMERGVNGA